MNKHIEDQRAGEVRSVPILTADRDRFDIVEMAGTVFVVDDETGLSYAIGAHGRRILSLLSAGACIEDAASKLAQETGGDATVVLEDTRRLVLRLVDLGLIVEVVG